MRRQDPPVGAAGGLGVAVRAGVESDGALGDGAARGDRYRVRQAQFHSQSQVAVSADHLHFAKHGLAKDRAWYESPFHSLCLTVKTCNTCPI